MSCQANTDDVAPHTSRTENVVKECIDLNAAIDDNSPFACGNGSASDPYRISHEVELWYLGRQNITEITAKNWYEKHFRIIFKIDMDLLATEWNLPGFRPIGSCGLNDICNDADDVPFTGYFTGRDSSGIMHEIHGLSLNLTGEDGVGLFGRTGTNAELHYMHLKNATVEGQQRSGILVGYASDTLINNSFVAGNLEGTDKVGGLVGEMSTSEIRASYSTATITATTTSITEAYAGGLVGYMDGGSINTSYAIGAVTASSTTVSEIYAGGLVGYVDTNGNINNSYAVGLVTSTAVQDAYGGGLVGRVNSGQVNQSYAMGGVDVTSTGAANNAYAGGLVGSIDGGVGSTIENSYTVSPIQAIHQNGILGNGGGLIGQLAVVLYWLVRTIL